MKHKKEDLEEQPEMEREPESAQQPATTKVYVIAKKGASVLVQWNEGETVKRGFVPIKAVTGDQCISDILDMAISQSVGWDKFIQPITISPERIANALYGAGFFTVQDIERDPIGAQSAINVAVGINAAAICRLARNSQREEKT